MRQNDARQTVDVDRTAPGEAQRVAEEARAAPDRDEAEHRDDGGQQEWRAEQGDERHPAGEPATGQRAGGGDGGRAERRGDKRLVQGEADRGPVGGTQPLAAIGAERERRDRSEREGGDKREPNRRPEAWGA